MTFVPFSLMPPPTAPHDKLVCVGDMIFDRGVRQIIERTHPATLFEKVHEFLAGDIVVGNLECPLSLRGQARSTPYPIFRGDPEIATFLRAAGFSALCLANNHILDYGELAALDTHRALKRADVTILGLQVAGNSQDTLPSSPVVSPRGTTVRLLAYTPFWTVSGGNGIKISEWEEDRVRHDIQQAQGEADLSVVFLHFGDEMTPYPPPEAQKMAHQAIDLGAALVVGHHPHVLGGIEIYKGKPIAYSLGDFIFDSEHPLRQQSAIMRFHFGKKGIKGIDYLPLVIESCIPQPAPSRTRQEIVERMEGLTAEINSTAYPEVYYGYASQTFIQAQWGVMKEALQQGRLSFLLQRLGHVRSKHLRLGLKSLLRHLYI